MSPASYLAAPPRVAASSIATIAREARAGAAPAGRYDRDMPWWAIVACAVFGAFAAAGSIAIVLSVIRLGRRSGSLQKALEPRIQALELSTDEFERKGYRAELGQARLAASVAALNGSVARVAVVDLGTNSTRLLVAEGRNGTLRELDRRITITRLGEGVDADRVLLPEA